MNDKAAIDKLPSLLLEITGCELETDLVVYSDLITGPMLVGDKVYDLASGKTFEIVSRTWQCSAAREANIVIRIQPVQTQP